MHDRECGARSVLGGRYRGAAAASNLRDNAGRRIDIPRRMDETDGACDFRIAEIDSLKPTQRGGKRKDRVAADRIIDGPVGRGTAETPDGARRFKSFSIEDVMAPPLSSSAFTLAEVLVGAMGYELNEDAMVDGGPMQLAFGLHLRHAVTTSGALDAELRSYRAACVAVRQRHIVRHGLNADPDRVKRLDGLVDANLLSYVLKIAREGVTMRADTPSVKLDAGPHQSAADHVIEAYVKCFEDFARCSALMVSDRSSVFLDDVFSSPFGRAPNKDVFGAITREGRFVHDCSYPKGASTNDRTPAANHAPAFCPMHVEAFLYIIMLCERLPGTPIRAPKRDVKAAFKLVWVAFSDMRNFATQLPAGPLQIVVNAALGFSVITVIFSVLVFGWTESPSNYGAHGWLLSEAHRRSGPEFWYELPSLAFFCLTFVDDGVLIEPVLGQRCVHSGAAYDWSVRPVLGWALNLKKLALEGVFSPLVLLWGVLVNLTLAEKGAFFVTCEMP